jgi:hypothetical protein
MTPPSASTRLIGKPAVAAVLYVASGLAAFEWIRGPVPWWLGIMALCFIGTVHNAVRELRRYNPGRRNGTPWAAMTRLRQAEQSHGPDGANSWLRWLLSRCWHGPSVT